MPRAFVHFPPSLHPPEALDLLVSTQATSRHIRLFWRPLEPLIYSRPLRSCLVHSFTLPPSLHPPEALDLLASMQATLRHICPFGRPLEPLIYSRPLRSCLVHSFTLLSSLHLPEALDLPASTQVMFRCIWFTAWLASTRTSDLFAFTQVTSHTFVHVAAQLASIQTPDLRASAQVMFRRIHSACRPARIHLKP
jgi:hypothetical protein